MVFSLRRKRAVVPLSIVAIALISLLSLEPAKHFVKSIPGTMEILALTHNLRNPPLSPNEAGNGSHASEIVFMDPAGAAQDSAGTIYIADRAGLIWKIDSSGIAQVIAGTGRRGRALEGRRAIETDLGVPQGIAFDSRNRLHIADSFNNVVLRIESDGKIKRVAGTGFVGNRGDGGPAIDASLNEPFDIRFDSDDNLFIVDFANNRVRKVDHEGIISAAAGTGEPGYSGDGGSATAARLRGPYGAFIDDKDRLYIADSGNHVIRRVDLNGVISTVAGSDRRGYAGDGGPATAALMDSPQFLIVDKQTRMIVGDEHNLAIRIVSPEGTISTLIGGTAQATPNEGLPDAQETVLNDPEAVLLKPDGSLLLVDGGSARVIRLTPEGAIEHFAGRMPTTDTPQENLN